jgi:chitin disaccharide deacetylase
MKRIFLFLLLLILVLTYAQAQEKSLVERLGYPAGSKLLIIHGDDLGVAHSVNRATFDALASGAASSASIMVPCPWFPEVVELAKANPEADLGIHLTLTSEWRNYKWAPLGGAVPESNLIDPSGYMWADVGSVRRNAKPEEVEKELRRQIDRVLQAGIQPTHIDSHMGTLFAPPLFEIYTRLAREYGLPYFAPRMANPPPGIAEFLKEGDVMVDHFVMAMPNVQANQWMDFYTGILQNLQPGVTQMIVHFGYDDAELQAVCAGQEDFGSAWRQRDLDVLSSEAFRNALRNNQITLIGWRELQRIFQEAHPPKVTGDRP